MSTSDPLLRTTRPTPASATTPALESFREAAQASAALPIGSSAEGPASFGPQLLHGLEGAEPVVWVQGADDATGMFLRALEAACGPELSAAIARELCLQPAPGRPLTSRDVQRALDAVETSRQALAGVDFFTLLQQSSWADRRGTNYFY